MEKFKLKTTKGPWILKDEAEKPYKIYAGDGKSLIATIPNHNGCAYIEDKANVRLFMHALEMFDALQDCCSILANANFCDVNSKTCEKCHIHVLLRKVAGDV